MVIPQQHKNTLIHEVISLRVKLARNFPWEKPTYNLTIPYIALAAGFKLDKPVL